MTITAERADLAALTDAQLAEVAADPGDPDAAAASAEIARRRHARAAKIRAASRERRSDPDAAAWANYEVAERWCRGDANMLSEAGRRTGRAAWPMLWQGSRAAIEHLCSDDLIVFWDYHQARPPSPNEYASAERDAATEQRARDDMPSAGMLAAIAAARGEPRQESAPPVAATPEPGSIVRFNAALAWMTRTAEQTARSLERVNGGIQR